jgi:hypothetical protein
MATARRRRLRYPMTMLHTMIVKNGRQLRSCGSEKAQ